ncbi:MAG: type II CAAX endopeptidase family protein [Hyphomicrobiaceae bacterium]|nr:type II CAAX endopeptidase family protein [Hyphomicrobiaceae bacterium]
MPCSGFKTLMSGPPAYAARTGWPPLLAVLATVVIGALSLFGAVATMAALAPNGLPDRPAEGAAADEEWLVLAGQLVSQGLVVALTLIAAQWIGSSRRSALALAWPAGGVCVILAGLVVVVLVTGAFSIVALVTRPQDVLADLAPLWTIMRSENALLLWIIAAIGAPASEEILFRGFLLSALAQSRLGFVGATLVTNVVWTALHAGYSLTGLVDVFMFGLVASWLLWRTGSLWVPIIAHAVYNGTLLAVLSQYPVPELRALAS